MNMKWLGKLLPDERAFDEALYDRHKILFLYSVFALAGAVALSMGFVRWQLNAFMGAVDFLFAAFNFGLLFYLGRRPDRIEIASSVAIAMSFVLFMAIYLLADYNVMRLTLFFLLIAAVVFLKGKRAGRLWTAGILISILAGYVSNDTGYSSIDIISTCIYLVAMLLVFENYESLKEAQKARERDQLQTILTQEQKRLQLGAEKSTLQAILDNSPLGIWLLGVDGRLRFVNKTFCNAVGVEEDRFLAAAHYVDLLPQQSAESCMQSDAACFSGEGAHHSREWMRFSDGQQHLLEITKVKLQDADGSVSGLIGIGVDITDRIKAEERLHLTSKVFENTLEGITITDAVGTILEVNEAFCTITGYSRDELIGQNPRMLQSGHQDAAFYAAMWQHIRETGHWRGEVWNRRKDGELLPEILTISAISDAAGTVSNYVGISSDITLLKQHERQLEHIAHYDALTNIPTGCCWRTVYARRWRTRGASRRAWPCATWIWTDSKR